MLLVSSCSFFYPIRWSQELSWEWRCSWSSADRRCSIYIWVINNLVVYESAPYIRDLTYICQLGHNCFRYWLVVWSKAYHYLLLIRLWETKVGDLFEQNYKYSLSWKYVWMCHLQNVGHFVWVPICEIYEVLDRSPIINMTNTNAISITHADAKDPAIEKLQMSFYEKLLYSLWYLFRIYRWRHYSPQIISF